MSDIEIVRRNKRERFLNKIIVLILTNIAAISFLTTGSAKLFGAESAILVHIFVLEGSPSFAMLLLILTSTLMLLKPIKN